MYSISVLQYKSLATYILVLNLSLYKTVSIVVQRIDVQLINACKLYLLKSKF